MTTWSPCTARSPPSSSIRHGSPKEHLLPVLGNSVRPETVLLLLLLVLLLGLSGTEHEHEEEEEHEG
jgi:hypothetical protein